MRLIVPAVACWLLLFAGAARACPLSEENISRQTPGGGLLSAGYRRPWKGRDCWLPPKSTIVLAYSFPTDHYQPRAGFWVRHNDVAFAFLATVTCTLNHSRNLSGEKIFRCTAEATLPTRPGRQHVEIQPIVNREKLEGPAGGYFVYDFYPYDG